MHHIPDHQIDAILAVVRDQIRKVPRDRDHAMETNASLYMRREILFANSLSEIEALQGASHKLAEAAMLECHAIRLAAIVLNIALEYSEKQGEII